MEVPLQFGPAEPFDYDSGLPDPDSIFPLQSWEEEMTADTTLGMLESYYLDSPTDTFSLLALSDTAKSPGRQSQQNGSNAGASSSLSPGNASLLLTPTSTLLNYYNDATSIEDPESDNFSTSPGNNISPDSDGYVHVGSFGSQPSDRRGMNNRPPPTSGQGHSGISGVRSPQPHHQHLGGQAFAHPVSVTRSLWPSFTSMTNSTGGWMDPQQDGSHFGQLNIPAGFTYDAEAIATTQELNNGLNSGLLPQYDSFDDGTTNSFDPDLSFRSMDDGADTSTQTQYPSYSPFASRTLQPHHHHAYAPLTAQQRLLSPQLTQYEAHLTGDPAIPPRGPHAVSSANVRQPAPGHVAHQLQSRPAQFEQRQQAHHHHLRQFQGPPVTVLRSTRRLQSATDAPSHMAAVVSSQDERNRRRGGRARGEKLAQGTREKSHKMRKAVACWRCALQRDPCPDEGTPCKRCLDKAAKGQPYYFACDRSKLIDLVFDFLPPSMTLMHQKQTIEDCVKDQVLQWDMNNSIDVYLTSGYGPALRWKLYEFQPRTAELLGQFQYLQDPLNGVSTRYKKYSPPFGLVKLDTSDDSHFEAYMDRLLDPQHLWDFGWTCFEEETQIDDSQARLLDLMCTLYMQTQDPDLQDLLKKIIRMMMITYIMGHTLTIEENTTYSVIEAVRHSPKPQHTTPHTSPRLANRQLKFFFCVLRNQVYENILNWQQQTLHSSKPSKEQTWLPAFCVMLGFAMVLEEVQRTIHIQADAKAQKSEMTTEQADTEAINACARIDERFKLLIGLFQCKYRDRKWGANGSFGNQTPQLHGEECERDFLAQLYLLMLEKREHLESRKDVALAPENQCRYTSRLVARFLLPFISLPPGGS